MKDKPTLKEAFKFWLKLGFISFGGPAGQVAIMHEFLVEKKKWISESKFLHALNYCMLLPGPEAQQLATYTGWLLHGRIGGLIAGVLFVLPSTFILLGLSIVYVTFGNIPWISSILTGLKPAVIAIIILALIKISKKSLVSSFHYLISIASFCAIFLFNIPFPIIILATILIAFSSKKIFPQFFNSQTKNSEITLANEVDYFINSESNLPNTGFQLKRIIIQTTITILLWFIPFILLSVFSSDFPIWESIVYFFTKAALVTFGGAYAVLPYVAQVSVEKYNWLSNLQMMDGLALGETTPGPLIMVLSFVGFMAGYNHFQSSLILGSLGLIITTFYTFLPSFFFILAGAPIIEKTQNNKSIKDILSIVSATVVGVILNLSLYLTKAVLFPKQLTFTSIDFISLIWIIISFIALYKYKVNMIIWIVISGIFGLVNYFIHF